MNWAYIAGIFDGEGSLSSPIGPSRAAIAITITQAGSVGFAMLKEIAEFLAQRGIKAGLNQYPHAFKHRKVVHRIYLYGDDVINFLRPTFPFLRIKRVVAQDVIRYRKMFPPFRGGHPPKIKSQRKIRSDASFAGGKL